MPRETRSLLAFNRGIQSEFGLARVDLNRTALAAETQTNWMPRVLGSMMLRPGWRYTSTTRNNALAKLFPFVFARDDTAELELTDLVLRIRIGDDLITRPAVTAAVTNGTFGTDLTGWTDNDETGTESSWVTGGFMGLRGGDTVGAIRDQQVTVVETGVEHALRIVVAIGPVTLRVGSSLGYDDYIEEATLGVGTHSLAFTPAGNFHIRLMGRRSHTALVDSITVESSGTLELPTPWPDSVLPLIRMDQSADVLFVACKGYQQRRIERRAPHSWSMVLYEPDTPPFRPTNTTQITLDLQPVFLPNQGDRTLTASKPLFRPSNVGSVYRIRSLGQFIVKNISTDNTFTDPIRITGIGEQREFSLTINGTVPMFVATFTLQYSVGAPGSWNDVDDYDDETSINYNDGFDNQVIYYRLGIKPGFYTSGGPVRVSLTSFSGSVTGIARVTSYTSPTVVNAILIRSVGAGFPETSDWDESLWSDRRGWPSAVAIYESRLWWPGKQYNVGSVTDDFSNFDNETEGDAGPIIRSIGSGPIDDATWMLPLSRLLLGTEGAEYSVRSNNFDEPVTPSNYNVKVASTQGSAPINAVRVDKSGIYVQSGLERVYLLQFAADAADYSSEDLTTFVPDLHSAGITHVAVQRKPDTRVHVLRADGTAAVLVFDRLENVTAWIELETDGAIEDAVVFPGTAEDRVVYVVRRTIDGATVRYREVWALESECQGGTLNKQADSFLLYSGAATATITGLDHLEGESVVVWGNGKDLGSYTVASGSIAGLPETVTSAVVGLTYRARFKSAKQAFAAALGSALNRVKRAPQIGLILKNTHAQGLRYGPDFDTLDELPLEEEAEAVDSDLIWDSYDKDYIEFPGDWETDQRICLEANAPRPATVLACSVDLTTHG